MKRKNVWPLCLIGAITLTNPVSAQAGNLTQEDFSYEGEAADEKETPVTYTQGSRFVVTIPKTIALSDEKAADYTVKVSGSVGKNEAVTVSPRDDAPDTDGINFTMTETNNKKSPVTADVTQADTRWIEAEIEEAKEKPGRIEAAGLSAGDWSGNLTFLINLENENTPLLNYTGGLTLSSSSGINTISPGQVLSVTAKKEAAENLSYQWNKNGTAIPGAVADSYTVAEDDMGATLSVTVTKEGISGAITKTFENPVSLRTIGTKEELETQWLYRIDKNAGKVYLELAKGSSVNKSGELTAYAAYEIDGVTYPAGMQPYQSNPSVHMFEELRKDTCTIEKITIQKGVDTEKMTDYYCFFGKMPNVTSIDASGISVANRDNISHLFSNDKSLVNIVLPHDMDHFSGDVQALFDGCESLTGDVIEHIFDGLDTSGWISMNHMFRNCTSITSLDLSNLNTANVTGMGNLFQQCVNLKNLNISSFDTRKVINMSYMFSGCESLSEIDVSNFNTENATSFAFMFNSCKNLKQLDLTNFTNKNAKAHTAATRMFANCKNLTEVKVAKDKWSNAYYDYLFEGSSISELTYVE